MRWYWKRDGRLPNAPSYKRNAASAYLHLVERREAKDPNGVSFTAALENVKIFGINIWRV